MDKRKILIVDDEKPTREVMARILAPSYECLMAPDAEGALEILSGTPGISLLVTDYKMPGDNGIALIKKAKAAFPNLAAILVTAFGEIELAVAAMKEGADDFLTKPITDIAEMELRIEKAIEKYAIHVKADALPCEASTGKGFEAFTGDSPAMEKVYRLVRLAARSDANVVVEGASGTGKELVARALHDLSQRAKGPFVAFECAALSPTLIESELFGHEKGAFTGADRLKIGKFEAANGGTLFLDEITEIDLATQVKLLRVIETRKIQRVGGNEDIAVDFRLVAATNRNLLQYVREGKFREDLYYRLDVIDIHLPQLKDRPGDVELLALRFLKESAQKNSVDVTGMDESVMKALKDYSWPGNVRQLRNVVEKMVVLSSGGTLTLDDVPREILEERLTSSASVPGEALLPVAPLATAEKDAVLKALAECAGNKTKAAEALGISRRTLHRKLNEWRVK
ncbi:MAG: sigma-54-dependent Fis family transcriptional regulator [Kiritimatiellae bacterium]|nr:sigma-54-dependent Fis family transcriptional regulator [Kiritimatiellia bacterium]